MIRNVIGISFIHDNDFGIKIHKEFDFKSMQRCNDKKLINIMDAFKNVQMYNC